MHRLERPIFAAYTCFVAYWIITGMAGYPWSWLLIQSVVLFFIRIHTRAAEPLVHNRHNTIHGDVYVVGEVSGGDPKRGYPGGRWLVKRNSTVGARPSRH